VSDIETGWLSLAVVLLIACIAACLWAAFEHAGRKRAEKEVDEYFGRIVQYCVGLNEMEKWQDRAIAFIMANCFGEAMAAGLIHSAPLIIGGKDAGPAAVYPNYEPGSESLNSVHDAKMQCPVCGWSGTMSESEYDVNGEGDLGCPECSAVVKMAAVY